MKFEKSQEALDRLTPEQRATLEDVTQYIYREARLQDDARYPWIVLIPGAVLAAPASAEVMTPLIKSTYSTGMPLFTRS